MIKKKAFITGVNGQDGAYLACLLLEKGYEVHGLIRRASLERNERIDDILPRIHIHFGDMTDGTNLIRLVHEIQPQEIYNLAAQSHVQVSFDTPEYTANTDALGTLRLLEAIRILGLEKTCRFYQASSSELFGNSSTSVQNENTPFAPASPYAAAKLYAYWIVRNYRDAYGIHGSNGILFNHESPLRGESFVSRKIARAVAEIKNGDDRVLTLGNLDARRDWGHAKDYVRGMWLMLQQERPDDYVLATGRAETVRFFTEIAFACAGLQIEWCGQGQNETGVCKKTGRPLVKVDPAFFRPIEVGHLCGDASKARETLGWQTDITLEALIEEMVAAEISK